MVWGDRHRVCRDCKERKRPLGLNCRPTEDRRSCHGIEWSEDGELYLAAAIIIWQVYTGVHRFSG